MFHSETTDYLEQGRDRAALRRHRGQHTGKMATGWDWKRQDPEKGSFERARQTVIAAWDCAKGGAQEDYLRAVFPERYGDDLTMDDVIAANNAAATASLLATF